MKRKEIKRLSIMLSVMMAVTSLPGQCIMAGEPVEGEPVVMEAVEEEPVVTETVEEGSVVMENRDEGDVLAVGANLPEHFDLRDYGKVTKVRNQDPWSTCWAFGACAAAEISILNELGLTPEQYEEKYGRELNLSEKQVVWFTSVPVTDGDRSEGYHVFADNEQDMIKKIFDGGGVPAFAQSVFASLCGPSEEYTQNKEATLLVYGDKNGGRDEDGDWSLDDSYRSIYSFELENGNILPNPCTWNNGVKTPENYVYDESAANVIKQELMKGHGVEISYYADVSTPEELKKGNMEFTNVASGNCAQYVDSYHGASHAACIVGWDDNYKKENFKEGKQPDKDGAWIIKNSWGSQTDADEGDPDYRDLYGYEDENGKKTGYNYLSYYDRGIDSLDSFDFITERIGSQGTFVYQHDLLPKRNGMQLQGNNDKPLKMANVFDVQEDMDLFAVSTETAYENTRVTFEIYKLNKDFKDPTDGDKLDSRTVAFDFAGYHRINLNGRFNFNAGDKYSIIVTQQANTDEGYRYVIGANASVNEEMARKLGYPSYATVSVEPKDSYYYCEDDAFGNKGWNDWADNDSYRNKWVENDPENEGAVVDNFSIKGFGELREGSYEADSYKALPVKFDLRDRGAVTGVKNQNPWSTCWAFGACAAAEISILTELGLTKDEYREKYGKDLNLSEKHLAWFTYQPVTDDKGRTEGYQAFDLSEKGRIKVAYDGGMAAYAESVFAQLSGPVSEDYSPDGKTKPLAYGDKDGKRDENGDWSLDDEYRYSYSYELENGNVLPNPAVWTGENKDVYSYDASATAAVKRELMKGHGVELTYYADASVPKDIGHLVVKYTNIENGQCAQYVDEKRDPSHGVCIVGWDDTFPKENFMKGKNPPKDGAWLVKNSWGSATDAKEGDPDYSDLYGIEDENGKKTGYNWVSYYDQGISAMDSFDFITERIGMDATVVTQHDYLPRREEVLFKKSSDKVTKMANVFEAPESMDLFAVAADTAYPDTIVNFEVYKLEDGFKDPTDGIKLDSKTASFEYKGYHRVNLNGKFHFDKGEKYSVVITEQASIDNKVQYVMNAHSMIGKETAKEFDLPMYATAIVDPGESYYYTEDESLGKKGWTDWGSKESYREEKAGKDMEKLDPEFVGLVFDNFSIKAFGDLSEDTSEKYDIDVSQDVEGTRYNYSITYKSNVSYNGSKLMPEVKVIAIDKTTGERKELVPKKDFKVKYKNNKDAGKLRGKIKISFKKDYKAENAVFKAKIFSFTILPLVATEGNTEYKKINEDSDKVSGLKVGGVKVKKNFYTLDPDNKLILFSGNFKGQKTYK